MKKTGQGKERGTLEGKKSHQNQTIFFENAPQITGHYSLVGEKEGKGPLGKSFHQIMDDEYFGEKTHEAAEQKMFEHAIRGAVKDSGLKTDDIDMMISGDLLNQITSSSFAARSFNMTFVGLYGACSTMALNLGIGASLVNAGYLKNIVVSAGSHFATAERQYRTPLELGSQKPPVAQWTVTGCGATVISAAKNNDIFRERNGKSGEKTGNFPKIAAITFGKVQDWGTIDPNNMGAAMAPAAAATLIAHFRDTGRTPADYDAIFSGDLGKLGENILRDLLANAGYPVDERYSDCGRMIFDHKQHAFQGGSGAGCSSVVLNGFILDKFLPKKGEEAAYKRILFLATGALLSPVSSFQGNTIPAIAHAVVIES